MATKQVRLGNLRHLIKREGAVSQLALRLQISPIYIYRVLDGKFNIGDSMARKIEDAYGFPPSWMDTVHEDDEDTQARIPTLETIEHEHHSAAPPPDVQLRPLARSEVAMPKPSAERVSAPVPPTLTTPVTTVAPPPVARAPEPKPVAAAPVPTPVPPAERVEDDPRERMVATLVNTLDRLLVTYNLDLSDLEKARILMKAAEAVLDSGSSAQTPGTPPKSAVKIS